MFKLHTCEYFESKFGPIGYSLVSRLRSFGIKVLTCRAIECSIFQAQCIRVATCHSLSRILPLRDNSQRRLLTEIVVKDGKLLI